MFTTPSCGWVCLIIDDFKDRASYLTSVPNNCLDAFIFGIENYLPASVEFDAEGWNYILVSTWYRSYIISEKDTEELFVSDKGIVELAKELREDIRRDF